MDRKVSSVSIGEGVTRHRVVLFDDYECAPGTQAANARFYNFTNGVFGQSTLLACGYSMPQRVLVTHNGKCWQIEAEADVTDPT